MRKTTGSEEQNNRIQLGITTRVRNNAMDRLGWVSLTDVSKDVPCARATSSIPGE
jgi:hypothetical protein